MADGKPVVLADDVIAAIPGVPRPEKRGEREYAVAIQRLRRLKLGEREAFSLLRRDLAHQLGITERSMSECLGVATRSHFIGVVTPLGIETLRDRAPEFCAWIERDAFPEVIKRFGKGGAA